MILTGTNKLLGAQRILVPLRSPKISHRLKLVIEPRPPRGEASD
jgi:hypothetical protein